MVSAASVATGLFIAALSVPFLLFPERSARIRHRNARDPEPTESAVAEAQLTGVVLLLAGVFVALVY